MSRSFRFSCNSSSLFKTFSNPFDEFIGGNLSAYGCPRNSRISFSKSSGMIVGIIVFLSYAIANMFSSPCTKLSLKVLTFIYKADGDIKG